METRYFGLCIHTYSNAHTKPDIQIQIQTNSDRNMLRTTSLQKKQARQNNRTLLYGKRKTTNRKNRKEKTTRTPTQTHPWHTTNTHTHRYTDTCPEERSTGRQGEWYRVRCAGGSQSPMLAGRVTLNAEGHQ